MVRRMVRRQHVRRLAALGVALMVPLVGCKDTLEVEEPEFLTPQTTSPELLVAGAVNDFNTSYSGAGGDAFLSTEALIADELFSSGTFTTRTATDQRLQFDLQSGNTSDGAYNSLQRARQSAIRATRAVTAETGPNDPRISTMKTLEGLSIVALAEGFCSNIPLSDVTEDGELVPGQPLSTTQLFETALSKFNEALAIDAGNFAAAVGKGRALLNLGRFQEAAAAVAGVPTSFAFQIEHSVNTGNQNNPIFSLQSNGRYSLSDQEGINGAPFRSAMDPRVPWVEDPAGGFDSSIPLFLSLKAGLRDSPVTVADGIEARLIEAEAALQAGDVAGWLALHNALRADVANLMAARVKSYGSFVPGPNNPTTTLPPLVDPGTADGRVSLHFTERAMWLHLNGHRLGDLRRLIRQYGRAENQVFPTGAYFKGGTYGNDVTLPLDFDEQNNPNWSIDMCNVDNP